MSRPARMPSRQSEGPVRSEASRIAILAAAQRVLDEVGAENFTIEAVAREARASKPTIYKWWGDKQSLLGEVYRIATPITAGQRVSETTVHDELVAFYNNLWSFWRDKSNADITRWLMRSALESDLATDKYREDYLAARTGDRVAWRRGWCRMDGISFVAVTS